MSWLCGKCGYMTSEKHTRCCRCRRVREIEPAPAARESRLAELRAKVLQYADYAERCATASQGAMESGGNYGAFETNLAAREALWTMVRALREEERKR